MDKREQDEMPKPEIRRIILYIEYCKKDKKPVPLDNCRACQYYDGESNHEEIKCGFPLRP